MMQHRPKSTLGGANHGWLDTKHHFSFAEYHDPARMGWGQLRVWNDDTIAAGAGFPPHPHRDMEIITYVRKGAISHKDSLGNSGRTQAGDVQVMSAGTGIVHAEFNQETEQTQIFQIWIIPEKQGLPPRWGTKPFPKVADANGFVVLASGFAEDEAALSMQAQARVLAANVKAGAQIFYVLQPHRYAYLVPATGSLRIGDTTVVAGDGFAVRDIENLQIEALEDSEIIMVDVS